MERIGYRLYGEGFISFINYQKGLYRESKDGESFIYRFQTDRTVKTAEAK